MRVKRVPQLAPQGSHPATRSCKFQQHSGTAERLTRPVALDGQSRRTRLRATNPFSSPKLHNRLHKQPNHHELASTSVFSCFAALAMAIRTYCK